MADERASRARIRLVALAVIRDGSRLLVRRYKAPNGDRYYRPLGGAVEFGERAAQTAIRELREEIGAEIENVRYLATLENIFERAGQPGHQIVFLFEADFADRSHYTAELIIGTESSGKRIEAVWVDVSQPLDGPLYPEGSLELLTAAPPVNRSSCFPGNSALPPRQMPQTVVSPASDGAHLSDQRPSRDRIRLLALAVIRDGPRLLVQAYKSPNGNRFYRPLGGAIEFGECSTQTVQREIREEIGAEIEHVRYLATLENIFKRESQPAHWIALHCEAAFVDRSLYSTERIMGIEASGKPIEAVWIDISQPLDGHLYPEGLLELLTAA